MVEEDAVKFVYESGNQIARALGRTLPYGYTIECVTITRMLLNSWDREHLLGKLQKASSKPDSILADWVSRRRGQGGCSFPEGVRGAVFHTKFHPKGGKYVTCPLMKRDLQMVLPDDGLELTTEQMKMWWASAVGGPVSEVISLTLKFIIDMRLQQFDTLVVISRSMGRCEVVAADIYDVIVELGLDAIAIPADRDAGAGYSQLLVAFEKNEWGELRRRHAILGLKIKAADGTIGTLFVDAAIRQIYPFRPTEHGYVDVFMAHKIPNKYRTEPIARGNHARINGSNDLKARLNHIARGASEKYMGLLAETLSTELTDILKSYVTVRCASPAARGARLTTADLDSSYASRWALPIPLGSSGWGEKPVPPKGGE